MTDMQITVPEEVTDTLVDMIEERFHKIGKTYHENGQSYQDDLKITGLRKIARQLGFEFELLSSDDGFAITRHPVTPSA